MCAMSNEESVDTTVLYTSVLIILNSGGQALPFAVLVYNENQLCFTNHSAKKLPIKAVTLLIAASDY